MKGANPCGKTHRSLNSLSLSLESLSLCHNSGLLELELVWSELYLFPPNDQLSDVFATDSIKIQTYIGEVLIY